MENENLLRLITIFDASEEAEAQVNTLRKAGFIIRDIRIENLDELIAALDENPIDLIVSKLATSTITAKQVQQALTQQGRDIPLLVIIPSGSEHLGFDVLATGARDLIMEGQSPRLIHAVKREFNDLKARRAHRRCEKMLHESEKRARSLIDSSRDAIAYVHDGMHIYANSAYLKMFGYEDQDDIQGIPIMDMVGSDDHTKLKEFLRAYSRGETANTHLDVHGQHTEGQNFKITMEFTPASMEGESCTQIIIRDQTLSKALEQKLSAMSQQDLLTGLYNRNYLLEQLDKMIARAVEGQTRGALFYITLDKYNEVKEEHGISMADRLLTDVAAMLKSKVSEIGVLARFAGPVYTFLIDKTDPKKAEHLGHNIRKIISNHICDLGTQSITTTASIGICPVNETTTQANECIKRAEKGCQQAQHEGGNTIHLFNPALEEMEEHEQISHWSQEIKEALKEDRFKLVFQPIVSLHGEPGAHYEVLVRMLNKDQETVPPGEFIPAAAAANLMHFVDRWIIINSLMILAKRAQQGEQTRFFIKLSANTLTDDEFIPWLIEHINTSKVDPANLVFEVSEDTALNYLKQAKQIMSDLKEINCRTAIENFGLEQNTFQSLKHLKIDYIKVHMDLIANLPQSMENQEKVKNIAEYAGSKNIQTIAAFIEDANSLAVLWQCSVNFIQGHFLQQPNAELNYDFDEGN
ncbi:MAG: EAL domain-containing protein [Gammaproteobacteria bacterium]|nr:EAL domain-containing protein [Gammaproteobacteria bacterium]MDH5651075.1 EAL domain-containing protein [Gammaproteobacteria bacterium]